MPEAKAGFPSPLDCGILILNYTIDQLLKFALVFQAQLFTDAVLGDVDTFGRYSLGSGHLRVCQLQFFEAEAAQFCGGEIRIPGFENVDETGIDGLEKIFEMTPIFLSQYGGVLE